MIVSIHKSEINQANQTQWTREPVLWCSRKIENLNLIRPVNSVSRFIELAQTIALAVVAIFCYIPCAFFSKLSKAIPSLTTTTTPATKASDRKPALEYLKTPPQPPAQNQTLSRTSSTTSPKQPDSSLPPTQEDGFKDWTVFKLSADGNCLFYTLEHLLSQLPISHLNKKGYQKTPSSAELRNLCLDYVQRNWEHDAALKNHLKLAVEAFDAVKLEELSHTLLDLSSTIAYYVENQSTLTKLDKQQLAKLKIDHAKTTQKMQKRDGCLCKVAFNSGNSDSASEAHMTNAIKQYIIKARKNKFFTGQPELYAAAHLFNVDIHIVRDFGGHFTDAYDAPFLCPREAGVSVGSISSEIPKIYFYHHHRHYDAFLPPRA